MNSEIVDLKSMDLSSLISFIQSLGEPDFRARQIFSWLYRPGISSFDQMTNISLAFRTKLAELAIFSNLELKNKEQSSDGTEKFAFLLTDGQVIESVIIPDDDRNTLCISSQVGCAMGCNFCLTGTMGLTRNLTASEIVNQVCYVMNYLKENGQGRINNLVFMGMGEPLANLDNLVSAITILTDHQGLDFSDRRITVSTCGLVPQIAELGKRTSVNLAISLHAADNKTRNSLMRVNKKYSLDEVLDACRKYPLPKRRRIMIEYILIKDINDSAADARNLVKILHGIPCKINLLPFNECDTLPYQCPTLDTVEKFQEVLRDSGNTAIIRQSRGSDISAACGQLANKEGHG